MNRGLIVALTASLITAGSLIAFAPTVDARREASAPTITRGYESSPGRSQELQPPTARELAERTYACKPVHAAALEKRRERIANAATVEEARELAVAPVRAARGALAVARVLAFWSDGLDAASARLKAFEERVRSSATQADVAREFTHLVAADAAPDGPIQLADLDIKNVEVSGPGNCHYNTGEIIAVVIGFLLFIIPGLILMIVLC